MNTGNDDKRRAGDLDDLPPTGEEARAQGRMTSMPLLWLLAGLLLVVIFVAAIASGGGLFPTQSPGPAPVKAASGA